MVESHDERFSIIPSGYNKKYLLFAYDSFDSSGGILDCKGCFNYKDELLEILKDNYIYDNYQVLDKESGTVIYLSRVDFLNYEDMCLELCKQLIDLNLKSYSDNMFEQFNKLNPNFNKESIISNLSSYSVGFKNSGFVECYLHMEVLIKCLKDNKVHLFLDYLPNAIAKIEKDERVSDSITNYLKSIF